MMRYRIFPLAIALLLGLLLSQSFASETPEAGLLLDRIQASWTGVTVRMDATMTISQPDKPEMSCELTIFRAGEDRTRVQFLSPKRHAGKVMLLAERKLWLYLPRARKVTQVPRRRDPFGLSSLFNDLLFDQAEISSAVVTELPGHYQLELRYHRHKVQGPSRISFDKQTLLPTRCDFFSPGERLLRSLLIDRREVWDGVPLPATIRVEGAATKWSEVRLEVSRFDHLTAEEAELCHHQSLGGAKGE